MIAEYIYNQNEDLFKEFPVSELLLSAILLDTVNLSESSGRTTEKDVEFAEELESYSTIATSELFSVAQKGNLFMPEFLNGFFWIFLKEFVI